VPTSPDERLWFRGKALLLLATQYHFHRMTIGMRSLR